MNYEDRPIWYKALSWALTIVYLPYVILVVKVRKLSMREVENEFIDLPMMVALIAFFGWLIFSSLLIGPFLFIDDIAMWYVSLTEQFIADIRS